MSRAARIIVGAVVAGTLAFVAVVAGVMAVAGSGPGGGFFSDLGTDSLDSAATAEVLDVDEDWDWSTVDVRFTTPDGEVVVTYVDWEWTDVLPEVGDDVDVVYDSTDPEWAFAAADPWVGTAPVSVGAGEAQEETAETDEGGARGVAGWVSLAALLGLVVTVLVTVIAALRAPAPAGRTGGPGPYAAQGPYASQGPYVTQGFVGQPYPPVSAGQLPPQRPAAPQPYPPTTPWPQDASRPTTPAPTSTDGWSAP